MGKISPVSAKYIIHARITIEGVVDKPDVIGSVFGQTEGLLGNDLELRELQRSGRIGRIEVDLDTKAGKSSGVITVPSSMDKTETVLIAAALETIQRIGPCNASVSVDKVEDVRISKRTIVIERAKELLSTLTHGVLPDSQEILDQVSDSVKMMDVTSYGREGLPSGPNIDENDELIIVEGRADVLNLLRYDIKNVIALNGTSVPQTIIELSKKKTITLFVDGDRGGDLIIKEMSMVAEIDYVAKAPDGKEVEEITKKEIHKALRSKIAIEQAKAEPLADAERKQELPEQREFRRDRHIDQQRFEQPRFEKRTFPNRGDRDFRMRPRFAPKFMQRPSVVLNGEEAETFKKMLDDLIGTHGAYILGEGATILGKVPNTELDTTIQSLTGIHAIVMDGHITREILMAAERANVKYLVAMDSDVSPGGKVQLVTTKDLE